MKSLLQGMGKLNYDLRALLRLKNYELRALLNFKIYELRALLNLNVVRYFLNLPPPPLAEPKKLRSKSSSESQKLTVIFSHFSASHHAISREDLQFAKLKTNMAARAVRETLFPPSK